MQHTSLHESANYQVKKNKYTPIVHERYEQLPVPEFTTKFSKVSSMATVSYPESIAISKQTKIRRSELMREMVDIPSAPPSTESGDIFCEHGTCDRIQGHNFGLVDITYPYVRRQEKRDKNPNKFVYQRSTMYTSIDEM